MKSDNVRVISAAGDVEIVGADIIAKLSAETSEDRPQRLGINALLSGERQHWADVQLIVYQVYRRSLTHQNGFQWF